MTVTATLFGGQTCLRSRFHSTPPPSPPDESGLDIDRKALVAAFDSFALSPNVPSIFLTVSAEVLRRVVEGFPRPKRNEFTFGPITGSGLTREEESLKESYTPPGTGYWTRPPHGRIIS